MPKKSKPTSNKPSNSKELTTAQYGDQTVMTGTAGEAMSAGDCAYLSDGSGGLILFWPSSVTDYVLEGAGTLPSATWNPVSYTTVGNENQATVQPGTGNQFYRLRK